MKNKKIQYSSVSKYSASHLFGSRYIFFKSELEKDNSELFNRATTHFNNIKQQINQIYNPEDIESFQFLKTMIIELENIAQNMQKFEMQYAQKLIKQIEQMPKFYSKDFKQQLIATYKQLESSDRQFDYLLFIRLLSELMNDHANLEQSIKEQRHNLEILKEGFSKLDKEAQQRLQNSYIWERESYSISPEIKKITSTDFIYAPLMAQLSEAFNNTMKELQNSPRFKELIQNLLSDPQSQASNKEIISFIAHYIVQNYKNLSSKKGTHYLNRLKKEILDLFNSQKKIYQDDILSFFSGKAKTLEEEAITKASAPLAKIFLTYKEATQKILLKKYTNITFKDEKEWNEWKHKLTTTTSKNNNFRRQLTIALRKGITDEYKKVYAQFQSEWIAAGKTIDIKQIQRIALKKIETNEESFSRFIHISRLSKDQIAEITSSPTFINRMNVIIQSGLLNTYYGGSQTKLKTDVHIMITFEPDIKQFIDSSVDQEFINLVQNYLQEFYKNFHARYKKESNQTTDVEKAYQAYLKQMEEMYKDITAESEKQLNKIEAQNAAAELLEKTFSEEISVKEYLFYNNEFGFHMGNLGAGERVNAVVANIYTMYDKMGLHNLPDENLIIESILNASSVKNATFFSQNDDTIKKIQQLLIGGAALVGFDAGFTYTKKFLNEIKSKFFKTDFKHIELYRFNTLFVPSSYIIYNIVENLKRFLNIAAQDLQGLTLKTNSSKIYINNNLSYDIFKNNPDFKKLSTLQKWETVADYAQQNVKVTMLFLSGLLDIFEQLPELIQTFK